MYNNKLYLINYLAGCSGAFLGTILTQFVNDNCNETVDYSNTINAHNHDLGKYNRSFYFKSGYQSTIPYIDQIVATGSKPIVLNEHPKPNWDEIFKMFPNTKNIIIQIDERTMFRKIVNMHYKIMLETFKNDSTHVSIRNYWDSLVDLTPDLHEYYIDNVPLDYLLLGLSNLAKSQTKRLKQMGLYYSLPDDYKKHADNILLINYYDLIHNQDYILETISDFIGYPIKPCITETYNSYIQQQSVLFPWLEDK